MAINLFDAGQEVLLNLSFARHPQLLFTNYGYTVALVGMIESIGSIIVVPFYPDELRGISASPKELS